MKRKQLSRSLSRNSFAQQVLTLAKVTFVASLLSGSLYGQQYVGKIEFEKGNVTYLGTGYLIDDPSFSTNALHACSTGLRLVTANHVLKTAAIGDRVSVTFPSLLKISHEFRKHRFFVTITHRDIRSDIALLEFNVTQRHALDRLPNGGPYCVGLNGQRSLKGSLYVKGFSAYSMVASQSAGRLVNIFDDPKHNLRFQRWIEIDTYADHGMSGGVLTDSRQHMVAMVLKKRGDSDPIKKPLTMAVPVSDVKNQITTLIEGNATTPYHYNPESESIAYQGITFKEISPKTRLKFATTNTQDSGTKYHDIGAEYHDIGGEYHDIGAEYHDVGSPQRSNSQTRVYIANIEKQSPSFIRYQSFLKKSYLLQIKHANGVAITMLTDLLRVIESSDDSQLISLMINAKHLDGRSSSIMIGQKEHEVTTSLLINCDALVTSISDDDPRFDLLHQLKQHIDVMFNLQFLGTLPPQQERLFNEHLKNALHISKKIRFRGQNDQRRYWIEIRKGIAFLVRHHRILPR